MMIDNDSPGKNLHNCRMMQEVQKRMKRFINFIIQVP